MKKPFLLAAFLTALTCAAQDLPTEIRLTNGFVMKDCTIVRWEPDSLTVKYAGGTVPVRLENIDPADRAELLSRREEVLRQQSVADEKAAKQIATAERKQQAAQEKHEARKQAEVDRRNVAIQQGLDQHHLVAGMTMDQVRSLYGPPLRSSSLTDINTSDWWIYPGLGKDGNGVPANLQIHFKGGLVTRWNNTQR